METFKISDNKNGYLSFDLRDLLDLIQNYNKYIWVVNNLDINIIEPNEFLISMNSNDFNYIEQILESKEYHISYDELSRVSKLNIQILNGEIIGKYENEIINMSVFDGSYWTIKTNVVSFIDKLKERFIEIS